MAARPGDGRATAAVRAAAAANAAQAARQAARQAAKQVAKGKTHLNLALPELDIAIQALAEGGYHQQARSLVRVRSDAETALRSIIDRQAREVSR